MSIANRYRALLVLRPALSPDQSWREGRDDSVAHLVPRVPDYAPEGACAC